MMILSRDGRTESRGTLKYTGRDIGGEEISLEFHDGDWRIAEEEPVENETNAESTTFVRSILNLIGRKPQWEGTATDLSEAIGGGITDNWVTRRLNEHQDELKRCGIAFTYEQISAAKRRITLIRHTT